MLSRPQTFFEQPTCSCPITSCACCLCRQLGSEVMAFLQSGGANNKWRGGEERRHGRKALEGKEGESWSEPLGALYKKMPHAAGSRCSLLSKAESSARMWQQNFEKRCPCWNQSMSFLPSTMINWLAFLKTARLCNIHSPATTAASWEGGKGL